MIMSLQLMSKVKNFNVRFRARHFAGDPGVMVSPDSFVGDDLAQYYVDPRETTCFKGIDHLASSFVPSFPREYQDPIRGGVVDVQLLVAILAPHVSVCLLVSD